MGEGEHRTADVGADAGVRVAVAHAELVASHRHHAVHTAHLAVVDAMSELLRARTQPLGDAQQYPPPVTGTPNSRRGSTPCTPFSH